MVEQTHVHLTREEARLIALGRFPDPETRLVGVLAKRVKGDRFTEGCTECNKLLFETFDRFLHGAEQQDDPTAAVENSIGRVSREWRYGYFCPPNIDTQGKSLAMQCHLRHCKVCSKALEVAARAAQQKGLIDEE